MVHKLALLIGGAASIGVLALAIGAAGTSPTAPPAALAANAAAVDGAARAADTQAAPDPTAPTTVKTVVDKVYIAPTPRPKVVRHPNTPRANTKPTVNTTQPKPPATTDRGERDDGDHEGAERGDRDHGDSDGETGGSHERDGD